MNRTREQWADVCPKTVAETASPAAVMCLVDDALSDIARLHRQADQLRAEVEALRAQANALHQVGHALGLPAGSDLTREVLPAIEALRKDAERYRWLRDPCSGAERVVMYGRGDYGRGLMAYTMLDEAIDAAIAAYRKGGNQ